MIDRRQLLQYGAGLSLSPFAQDSFAKAVPSPKRAVFLFVPMGGLDSMWSPRPCKELQVSGSLAAPFADIAKRCAIPASTYTKSSGWGQAPNHLCASPYELGADSLDHLIAASPLMQSPGGHLRLCARDEPTVGQELSVTVATGRRIELRTYEHEPEALLNRMQAYGLPSGFNQEEFLSFDGNVDSAFSWRTKRFLTLMQLALQTNYSKVITFMIGNDEAQVSAPPELEIESERILRYMAPSGDLLDFLKFKNYIHGLIINFIKKLALTLDENGRPLLDTTMIYLFSNMGEGFNYGSSGAPIVLAGADETFRTGSITTVYDNYQVLNAISYGFFGPAGLIFGDEIALNLIR